MTDQLPEAPASANVTYKRKDGFIIQLTLRDETGVAVLKRLDGALDKIVENGGTPHERSFGSKFPAKPIEYVENRTCPKCGSRLVKAETKDGKKMIKCETNKWNALLRKAEGCDFIEWLQPAQALSAPPVSPERDIKDFNDY